VRIPLFALEFVFVFSLSPLFLDASNAETKATLRNVDSSDRAYHNDICFDSSSPRSSWMQEIIAGGFTSNCTRCRLKLFAETFLVCLLLVVAAVAVAVAIPVPVSQASIKVAAVLGDVMAVCCGCGRGSVSAGCCALACVSKVGAVTVLLVQNLTVAILASWREPRMLVDADVVATLTTPLAVEQAAGAAEGDVGPILFPRCSNNSDKGVEDAVAPQLSLLLLPISGVLAPGDCCCAAVFRSRLVSAAGTATAVLCICAVAIVASFSAGSTRPRRPVALPLFVLFVLLWWQSAWR